MADEEGAEQEQLNAAHQKRLQQMQMDMKKRELLKRMLSASAYERMMNVRIAAPELYEKVVSSLAYVAQSGKPMAEIGDGQLRDLLVKMTQKRETSIEFRSK